MIVSQVLDELGISLDHELSDITPGLEKPHIQQTGGVSELGQVYNVAFNNSTLYMYRFFSLFM